MTLSARLASALGVCFTLLCPLTGHAQVYKQVAPDGTISYTDKPADARSGATETELRPKAPGAQLDPVKASLTVYAQETTVESIYTFCAREDPLSEPTFRQARNQWLDQHAQLTARKIPILHERFSREELLALAEETRKAQQRIYNTLRGASRERIAGWCRDAPRKLSAPELSPRLDPQLVMAIMNYRPSAARSAAGINSATSASNPGGTGGTATGYTARPRQM